MDTIHRKQTNWWRYFEAVAKRSDLLTCQEALSFFKLGRRVKRHEELLAGSNPGTGPNPVQGTGKNLPWRLGGKVVAKCVFFPASSPEHVQSQIMENIELY